MGARAAALSSLLWLWLALGAAAHEVRPTVADVTVGAETVRLELRVTLEPLIAGIDLAGLTDTNDSPLSGLYDRLRLEDPAALEADLRAAWPGLRGGIVVQVGDARAVPEIVSLHIPEVGDTELPRDSRLVLEAPLPAGDTPVRLGWSASYGPLVIRHNEGPGQPAYSAFLADGSLTDPMPRPAGGGLLRRLFGGD